MIFKSIWLPYIGKVNFSLGEKVEKIFGILHENDKLKALVDVLDSPHLGIIHDVLNIPYYRRYDYLFTQWFLSYLFLSFQEELKRRKISTRIIPGNELVQTVEFFQFYFLINNLGHLPYSFPVEEAIFSLNNELYYQELKSLLKIYFTDSPSEIIENTTNIILDICKSSRRMIFYVNSLFVANFFKKEFLEEELNKLVENYIKITLFQILNRISSEKPIEIFLKEKISREDWCSYSKLFTYYRLLKRIRDLSIVLLDSQFSYSKFIFNTEYIARILNFIEDDQVVTGMLRLLNYQIYRHPALIYWENKLREQIFNSRSLLMSESIESMFLNEKYKNKIYCEVEDIKKEIKEESRNNTLKFFPKSIFKYIKSTQKDRLNFKHLLYLLVVDEQEISKMIFEYINRIIINMDVFDRKSYLFLSEWVLWAISLLLTRLDFSIELNLKTVCFILYDPEVIQLISLGKKLVENNNYCYSHEELNKLEILIETLKKYNIKGFFFYSLELVNNSDDQQKWEIDYLFVFKLPDQDKLLIFLGEDKDLNSKRHLINFFKSLKDKNIFADHLLEIHLIDDFKSFIEGIVNED